MKVNGNTKANLEQIGSAAEGWKPEEVLAWAFDTFGDKIAIATGFGVEGMALLDIASRVNPELKLFTGDTEFLFPETYDLMDRVEEKYNIKVERLYSQLTPEDQEREHGLKLWERDPDQCCALRKVEPLRRKLATLDAWVTAIRRGQTSDRATVVNRSGVTSSATMSHTTRCTTRIIPASDALIAPAPLSPGKTRALAAGPASAKPNAVCTPQRRRQLRWCSW